MSSKTVANKLTLLDVIWFVFAHLREEEKPAFAFILDHLVLHTFFYDLKQGYKKSGYSGRVRQVFKSVCFDIWHMYPYSSDLDSAFKGTRTILGVYLQMHHWREGLGQATVIGRNNDQLVFQNLVGEF